MDRQASISGHPAISPLYARYLGSLLQGDRQTCLEIVKDLMDRGVPLKNIYLELFERSMYEVGALWENNTISVAVEHLATSITESAMGLLHPIIFATERCGRKAVVSCIANEYHQIGGKMVADMFEFHGWDGYFLGANTPFNDLLGMVEEKQPDLICLSLTLQANMADLAQHSGALRRAFPQTRILVGGQAFRSVGREALDSLPQVELVTSLDELERIILDYS